MNPNRLILAGTAAALVVPSLLVAAVPGSAATIDLGTRAGDVVNISAPATAKRMKLFTIKCQAPTDLSGGRVHLYQNGNIFKLSKVKGTTLTFGIKFDAEDDEHTDDDEERTALLDEVRRFARTAGSTVHAMVTQTGPADLAAATQSFHRIAEAGNGIATSLDDSDRILQEVLGLVFGQQFQGSAQGSERHAVLGGEAGLGRQRRARGPLAGDDAVAQCGRQRGIAALPGFGLDQRETPRCHARTVLVL